MKIRYYNAKIMTVTNKDCSIIEGELHTENDKIVYIGEKNENNEFEREIDVKGASSLGIANEPVIEKGMMKITCTKVGSGKISVKAIAGGDKLGGGDSIGGMEFSKEISIASRPYVAGNGGWL